jgi:hypothetical protein
MLGASQLVSENAAYGEAETIRRAILKSNVFSRYVGLQYPLTLCIQASEKEAIEAMSLLARDVTSKGLTSEELQIEVPFLSYELKDPESVSSDRTSPTFSKSPISKKKRTKSSKTF